MKNIKDRFFFFVGIKGTGMSALAVLLKTWGARVEGVDVSEVYSTDLILNDKGILFSSFDQEKNLPLGVDVVVYSAAYHVDDHVLLREAQDKALPCFVYSQMLGEISKDIYTVAIAGTHGKTSTTAFLGTLLKSQNAPVTCLCGARVHDFENSSVWSHGKEVFVVEACEYHAHFDSIHADMLILTNVEWEHVDFFPNQESVEAAFTRFVSALSLGASVIYCADDPGARRVVKAVQQKRKDLLWHPYSWMPSKDVLSWSRANFIDHVWHLALERVEGTLCLNFPQAGKHFALNLLGAWFCFESLYQNPLSPLSSGNTLQVHLAQQALLHFRGIERRLEKIFEGFVILYQDFGHHPSEVRLTLLSLREMYQEQEIWVDFMSHTYSRTRTFLTDFIEAFEKIDGLFLRPIFSSAREEEQENDRFLLQDFGEGFLRRWPDKKLIYAPLDNVEALELYKSTLSRGNVLLSLGAGNHHQSVSLWANQLRERKVL